MAESGREEQGGSGAEAGAAPPRRGLRLALLAALVVGTLALGHGTGLTSRLSVEGVRTAVEGAGWAGVLGFLALFVVGELVHVPGLVFVAAAVAMWGPLRGGAIASLGALASLVTSFVVVRAVGGTPLGELRSGLARRVLGSLERRPVATVAAARAVFVLAPPVTYALALSGVRFRDYLLGSTVGLVPPLTVAVLLFDGLLGL